MCSVTDTAPLVRLLEHTPSITLAVLFGSAARGVDGPGSDVDVGVLFASDAARREGATALGVALERACGRPVDLVALNDAPPLLRFEIARHAVVLVERSPHTWSDFRVQAALDWWDWAPTARRMYAAAVSRVRVRGGTLCPETSSSGDSSASRSSHVLENRDGTA
jgi:predicted nucleotidyltransferase